MEMWPFIHITSESFLPVNFPAFQVTPIAQILAPFKNQKVVFGVFIYFFNFLSVDKERAKQL